MQMKNPTSDVDPFVGPYYSMILSYYFTY